MFRGVVAFVSALLFLQPTPAFAQVTYSGSTVVRGSTYDTSYQLFITTDGTLGALSNSNITDFQIYISDGVHDTGLWLSPSNSLFDYLGGLSATANDLLFDFSGSGRALFQYAPGGTPAAGPFLCFAAALECDGFVNGQVAWAGSSYPGSGSSSLASYNYLQGNLVIASATSGVPEPATWVMMFIGFAATGFALRGRAKLGPSSESA